MSDAAIDALVKAWRAVDYPRAVRLVALLPTWLPYAHEHLACSDEVVTLLPSDRPKWPRPWILRAANSGGQDEGVH